MGETQTRGQAFQALDRETGQQVVLRTLETSRSASVDEEGLRRQVSNSPEASPRGFFEERLESPSGSGQTLVRPFVDGAPVSDYLDRAPLPLTAALNLVRAVTEDLEEAHEEGVLHGNLEPSNVIVPADRFEEATVVDFGLRPTVEDPEDPASVSPRLARYVSPERAGLLEEEPSEASDLYTVGLLFYHALTGKFPYDGDDFGEVLRAHLTVSPDPVRRLNPDIPRAVGQVIERLLRPQPGERYQTAAGLRADLETIQEALDEGRTPDLVPGTEDRRDTLARPGFLDRREELSALERQAEAARRGEGGVAVIEAVSGGGKTRLIEEFTERGPISGLELYRGEVHEGVAQRPFQAVRGIVHAVATRCVQDPARARQIREDLGDHADAVCEAFPPLAEALQVDTDVSLGPDEYGEERTLAALSRLLDALGTPEDPALVILDDCQWADEMTVRLLERWSHEEPANGRHTTVVTAYRADEVPEDHRLRDVHPSLHLEMSLFSDEQVADLARSMAGPVPGEALEVVTRLAEGNPFMTTAVLRGLIESGALVYNSGWEVDAAKLDEARAAEHSAAFLRHRLDHLPGRAQRFLTGAAILGKEFRVERAAHLVDLPSDEVHSIVQEAVDRSILWPEDEEGYAFAHDKLRETLLDRLSADRRRRYHLEAAERIEDTDPEAVFELAHHFHQAGQPERGLGYALPAAEQARERYALEAAETYYRIASKGVESSDRETRFEIQMGLGETLMLAGEYEKAQRCLDQARELAHTEQETAEVEGQRGELAFKRGDMAASAQACESALTALGERIPSSTPGYLVFLVWETLVQALHSLLPSLTVGRHEPEDEELLAVGLYNRLTYVSWYNKGPIPTLWAHLRELNLAERYPPTSELSQTYATHAPVMTQLPWFSRGDDYGLRGIEIAQEVDDRYQEGAARHFRGLVLYAATRYEEALETLREGEALLEQTGDRWQANNAGFHIAFCLYRLGRTEDAVEKAKSVFEAADRIGDLSTLGLAVEVWAKASGGQVPQSTIEDAIERIPEHDAQTFEAAHQALGVHHLAADQPQAAFEAFERAGEIRDEAGLRSEYVAPIPAWKATALRRTAEDLDVRTPRRREQVLERAAQMARNACRIAFFYANNKPHAYRERGLIAAMRGHPRWARYWLNKSVETAREQSARAELAHSLEVRAEVGEELDWDRAATDAQRARNLSVDLPEAEPEVATEPSLSLLDRYSSLLETGRAIASEVSEDDIHRTIHDASRDLLRATHAVLVDPRGDGNDLDPIAGDTDHDVDARLVRRALAEDDVLCHPGDEPMDDGPADPSILVAPVKAHGETPVVLYVAHDALEDLFGETDRQIASFLAAIGGAALERARTFEELAELNTQLEEKVEARTQELEARVDQQARLAELGRQALGVDDPEALMERVCDVMNERVGADITNVLELDDEAERIQLRMTKGAPMDVSDAEADLARGSQAGYTLIEGGPVVVEDLHEEERFEAHELLLEAGVRSSISTPIPAEDDWWGVLGCHSQEPHGFSEDDANFLQAVANVLGAAIQQREARRKLEERARALEASNEELERALSLQHATLDATADGILVVDRDGDIVTYNDRFQEMWRIPDEVVEQGDDEAALEYVVDQVADPEAFVESVEELYANPEEERQDYIEFEDGRIFERYTRPQRLGDRIVGRVWSFRDVTEIRQALRDLEQTNEELERANEDLRQFAYVASHDLQEPVRMVGSYVQLLENRYGDQLDEEAQEYIDYAVEGAQRLRDLIQGLLTYSRVDTSRSEPEAVDLNELLEEVQQTLELQAEEAGAQIEVGDLPVVEADRSQLSQVFQNLLSNAIKFSKEDEPPRIEVRAEREEDAWRFSVEDNGIGMDPDHAEQLFTIFRRGEGRADYGGQGVGLAVCKKVIKRHGGDMWVDTERGEGSTFHFTIPDDPQRLGSASDDREP